MSARLLLLIFALVVCAVFAAFENCPNQEDFDTCAGNEIDRIMTNQTVMDNSEMKAAEYHSAMEHCWNKHCLQF